MANPRDAIAFKAQLADVGNAAFAAGWVAGSHDLFEALIAEPAFSDPLVRMALAEVSLALKPSAETTARVQAVTNG